MDGNFLCIMAGYDPVTNGAMEDFRQQVISAGFIGTQSAGIPHHITLGTAPVEKEAEIIQLVHRAAKQTAPFPITFNHAGIFQGSKVLFIGPDCSHQLLDLKEHFGSSYHWTPHTTMLIDSPENVVKAAPVLLRNFSAFGGMVTQLHLYEFWPARHILTVDLKISDNW